MKKRLLNWLCLTLQLISLTVQARHIVGGEIRMEPSGTPDQYTITLVQFWDENTLTTANRDAQVEVLIYRKKDNQLVYKTNLPFQSTQSVNYQNKACASFRSLKTVQGLYSQKVTLLPANFSDPAGYYIVWERCCRNEDINNIVTPGANGMVFYLEFPPLTLRDTSPEFSFPNGQYICKDQPFQMNMSATDADDDELRYALVTPMRGNTSQTSPLGNDSPKANYPLVEWSTGISLTNAIPGNPPLQIDPITGIIRVTARDIGLFVFTIQCEEYRNGRKIGLVRRDFQLLVIECNRNTPPEAIISFKQQPADLVEICPESPLLLETDFSPQWSYQWQLNGQNIPGEVNPSITVKDTGSYSVVKSYKTQCSKDTTSKVVKVVTGTPPLARLTYSQDVLCDGQSLDLVAETGATYTYQWQNDAGIIASKDSILSIQKAGRYVLHVRDESNGCTATDSVFISQETLKLTVPKQISIQRGREIALSAQAFSSSYPLTYQWAPTEGFVGGNDSIPVVAPQESITYNIKILSPAGCEAEDSIHVIVLDRIYIPDAFSPNGDGINDQLIIYNGSDQIEEIHIFNRWGLLIYSSKGYSSPWNGTYNNEPVPSGTYIYQIKTPLSIYEGSILVLY